MKALKRQRAICMCVYVCIYSYIPVSQRVAAGRRRAWLNANEDDLSRDDSSVPFAQFSMLDDGTMKLEPCCGITADAEMHRAHLRPARWDWSRRFLGVEALDSKDDAVVFCLVGKFLQGARVQSFRNIESFVFYKSVLFFFMKKLYGFAEIRGVWLFSRKGLKLGFSG